ncbi:MAG TPA: tyrosine-type recombinase/integrase [Pedococcus sp.]|nr:tyrosine-type recombinase/integrase [Pedococcus sp.]
MQPSALVPSIPARERVRLSEALERFVLHCEAQHARRTVYAYRITNVALLAHTGDLYADELRPVHLDRWFAHLRGPHVDSRGRRRGPIGAGGFNAYLSRVRPFLTWMYLNDLIDRDFGKTLHRMRRPHRVKLQLDAAQVRALLEDAATPRDRALIAVGFFTAMRRSELQAIRLRDVDLDRGTVFFRVWKSDTEDVLPLGPELRSELHRWLAEYERNVHRHHHRGLLPAHYLIPAYLPRRYAPGLTVVDGQAQRNVTFGALNPAKPAAHSYRVVKDGLRRLGLPDHHQGVHTLRRSAARQMFDTLVQTRRYDGALRVVQALLHHSTLATTEEYIGLTTEALTRDEFLRTAVLLHHPGQSPGRAASHAMQHLVASAPRASGT